MMGNDLIEFQQMKRHQESLLGEAERIRFLAQASSAPSRNGTGAQGVRKLPSSNSSRPSRVSPGRLPRIAAARVGSALVLIGNYLQGLDGCRLNKG